MSLVSLVSLWSLLFLAPGAKGGGPCRQASHGDEAGPRRARSPRRWVEPQMSADEDVQTLARSFLLTCPRPRPTLRPTLGALPQLHGATCPVIVSCAALFVSLLVATGCSRLNEPVGRTVLNIFPGRAEPPRVDTLLVCFRTATRDGDRGRPQEGREAASGGLSHSGRGEYPYIKGGRAPRVAPSTGVLCLATPCS